MFCLCTRGRSFWSGVIYAGLGALMVYKGGSTQGIIKFLDERAGWATDLVQVLMTGRLLKSTLQS
jgi:hypothetical protein